MGVLSALSCPCPATAKVARKAMPSTARRGARQTVAGRRGVKQWLSLTAGGGKKESLRLGKCRVTGYRNSMSAENGTAVNPPVGRHARQGRVRVHRSAQHTGKVVMEDCGRQVAWRRGR